MKIIRLQGGIKPEPKLFMPSVTKGCVPLDVMFKNTAETVDSCRWTFGDGGFSNEINPEWIFDIEGTFKVVLNLFSSDGQVKTYSQIITVYPRPQAQFETAPGECYYT